MYEIWEVVKMNDYEFEPLLLVDRTDDIERAIRTKNESQNYILTDKEGNQIVTS